MSSADQLPDELSRIYEARFGAVREYRLAVWDVLTTRFFQRWIGPDATVLDLGCGYGEFINSVRCRMKYGMDLNPDAARFLADDVTLLEQDCSMPWKLENESVDVVFTSNFLEHLLDKAALSRTLHQAYRCLRPGGRLIAMGPNIRYLAGEYWDFFDHHLPLTERSLGEGLQTCGLTVTRSEAKFLPYTMVNAPRYPLVFLKAYLAMPLAWKVMGGQFLVVAEKAPLRTARG
jgi:SAM-dependent methyltransferase